MPSIGATVETIATRLDDIAANVASEAAELTRGVREIGEHARDITALAADLERTALEIDEALRAQLVAVAAARDEFATNRPALAALGRSAETIASMSARIRGIAANSRMLSLNARIEAARHGEGNGFAAVAQAMGQLSAQTQTTTDDIDREARQIVGNVEAAGGLIQSGNDLADRQHERVSDIAIATADQHATAAELRRLTGETVERVDDAAVGIGRVSSAASIVGMLARQLKKLAASAPEPSLA